ncbi:MFS transporter, partial [Kutzneria albida]|uniref:Major facilitator superfamily (MFS) profile domain-containing protein n=1 Tax=Kutzneria albida DSM 43870 TaxID=1449976 RepID=W5WCE7_9PSEU
MFLINLPLGLVAFLVAWRLIPAGAGNSAVRRLDWLGVLLLSTGLGGLTYTAHLVSETSTGWALAVTAGAVSLLLLALATWHLLRTAHPLVELRTLRFASLRASVLEGSLFWIAVGAVPFLLPLLFQDVFGWSPVKSGAVVLFVFAGNIGIKPATTYLLNRFGYRKLLAASAAVMAASVFACALITDSTPLVLIAAIVLISGAARSVGLTGYSTIAFSDVTEEHLRHANTLSATATQTAAGLGVAAATVALRAGDLLPGNTSPATSYGIAFALITVLPLVAMVGALRLHPATGDSVRQPAKT